MEYTGNKRTGFLFFRSKRCSGQPAYKSSRKEDVTMLHIETLDDGLPLFKALGSEVRIEIVKLLLANKSMNINELAGKLNLSNGALTNHIKLLENCGILKTSSEAAGHGNQKICSIVVDKVLIDIDSPNNNEDIYNACIKIGHFTDYQVYPTCGLATSSKVIGEVDDARYFAHPDRYDADILWFTRGYVEYTIPNFIPYTQKITQIMLSAELSSEAPGVNSNWPSDISFYLNHTFLGSWTSPGDFGDVRGIFTPRWWFANWNQYGLLKMLTINRKGTFVDGLQISDVSIDQFHLDSSSKIFFRFAVEDNSEHIGGLTIFGKSFGNYAQDINVSISYSPLSEDEIAVTQKWPSPDEK